MNHITQRLMLSLMLSVPAFALAQGASPRETPRPQDIDPGVNTSAPSQAPARDTPRPQDIDPAVNTSASAPANESDRASSSTSAGAAASGAPAKATANRAAKGVTFSGAAAAAAANASGAPSSAAGTSTPNPSSARATAGTKPAVGPDGKPLKGKALDRLELDTTQITGNRELPKVLYIVPWKRSDLSDLTGKPVNSLLDEVLTPVDRDVFKRENRYYRALEAAPANGNGAPSQSTSPGSATETGSASPAARDER